MKIIFRLASEESAAITPLKTAEALIESGQFDDRELEELIAYLSVYIRYNKEAGELCPANNVEMVDR